MEPRATPHHRDAGVHLHRLDAEQVLHVLGAEEVPADDGGEGEEQQADGHVQVAEALEHGGEGHLGHVLGGGVLRHVVHVQAPLVSITRAVMVRTMKVSMNTQIIATMP